MKLEKITKSHFLSFLRKLIFKSSDSAFLFHWFNTKGIDYCLVVNKLLKIPILLNANNYKNILMLKPN